MCKKRLQELYKKNKIDTHLAFEIQKELSSKVVKTNRFGTIRTVAGADLAVTRDKKKLLCGIVVFSFPEMEIIEKKWDVGDQQFPYIPGLLAFREGPALIKVYRKLSIKPDILIIDGQGLAHPRKFGVACHIGVLLEIPTMGIAKKRLYGEHEEPNSKRGSSVYLTEPGTKEIIGAVVRTRDDVKPVFVSVGHKMDLDTTVSIALSCNGGYRIPEPTRQADKYVSDIKKERIK